MNLQDMSRESKRRFGNLLCQAFPTLRGVETDDAVALLSIARETIEGIAKKACENPVNIPESARQPVPGFEKDLGPFEVIFRDPFCGEPVAWGFRITNHLGEDRFMALGNQAHVECIVEKEWAVISLELTPALAVEAYGELKDVEVGPRGGARAATYGQTRFTSRRLCPTASMDLKKIKTIEHDH